MVAHGARPPASLPGVHLLACGETVRLDHGRAAGGNLAGWIRAAGRLPVSLENGSPVR